MIYIIFLIFGLIFGSFLAAFSYRYPRGIKISKGRSFCDNCGKKIEWHENIPVLSYILLKGKCKECNKKISIRYPIIEFLTALGFLIIYHVQGTTLNSLFILFIFLILEAIFIIDFEFQIIPDELIFIGLVVSFIYYLYISNPLFNNLAAGFISSSFLALIFIFTKGRGMGLGDVKFAVWGGMLVGIGNLFVWMMLAFSLGAIIGIILILFKNAGFKDKIAFGPFLVIAIPLVYICGPAILKFMGV